MSVLNRITTILRANVNDLLDRAEDPEKMMAQILRDMQEAIGEARSQVAEAMAQGKIMEANLKQAQELTEQWGRRAELAVRKGADDLARECLQRKRDYETNVRIYQEQVAAQDTEVGRLKRDLDLLQAKYAETQRNSDILLARYRVAEAREKIQKSAAIGSLYDPSSALSRMEERIALKEARVEARSELQDESLEARLARLGEQDADLEIEAQLLELKAKFDQPQLPASDSEAGAPSE
jgi:phage shock protein A